uniref:Cross-pathway control protein 1 n=1 Tax=Podospora anserina (strain S / ATCC MYA-4624 / DSM 980 / FGSC 10383) TaxID=515849 RepID=A0A090CQD6_PODAN|nr:Putative Cross-pathway control protein [Podospora anserina S mat+]
MPLPSQVELNYSTQLSSSRSGSHPTTAIPGPDFSVFTTDSHQSSWTPSSTSSLPAHSAHQQPPQNLSLPQQDFVLFDSPINHRPHSSRTTSQPSAHGGVNQPQQYRNQPLFPQQIPSPSLQNQRVANIIQATGHSTTSSAFTNRFTTQNSRPSPQQFYASSAPSSSVALNIPKQRQHRPPVPLFPQGPGGVPPGKMNIQGNFTPQHHLARHRGSHMRSDLDLDDFTAFEGGASTTYSSPALPTVFDLSSSVSSTGQNLATVSPQELMMNEPFMSAPNSTAFTALTSPSLYNGSPDFCDSYETSPHFGGGGDFDSNPDNWFPLFPTTNTEPEAPKEALVGPKPEQSPVITAEELEVKSLASGHRRKSSTSPPTRHSSIAGVNSRRRDKPLPPIIVDDPTDTVAMKRARNTLAARKSRERKAARLDELEEKIEKLSAERDHWKQLALQLGAKE